MRGQDSHETMKVRPFSGHRHRRGKASPQGVPGRSTGPGKDTAGRSECGSGRTGRLTAPAYQSVDRLLVRGCDLENRNPGLLHKTEKACAIASSRLYTDVLQVTEGPHPGEH